MAADPRPLLLALALAGCADPRDDVARGEEALRASDPAQALVHYATALTELEPDDELHLRARVGWCRARTYVEPRAACDEFLELARASGARLREVDWVDVATTLLENRGFLEAAQVARAGLERHPSSTALREALERVRAAAEAAGDAAIAEGIRTYLEDAR
jgi:hypothetical protein